VVAFNKWVVLYQRVYYWTTLGCLNLSFNKRSFNRRFSLTTFSNTIFSISFLISSLSILGGFDTSIKGFKFNFNLEIIQIKLNSIIYLGLPTIYMFGSLIVLLHTTILKIS